LTGVLDEQRRDRADDADELLAGQRFELARKRAEPPRGQPRREHLLDLLAEVLPEGVERLLRTVARERVEPDDRRLRRRQLEPHQLVAARGRVEPVGG
jgi:hypothetical protein